MVSEGEESPFNNIKEGDYLNEQDILFVIIKGVVPLIIAVMTIAKPIMTLNRTMEKLIIKVDVLTDENRTQDERISKHGVQIDDGILKLENHEHRINSVEKDIEKLKGE
ncbi:hypothetical protein [Peptostreptococcus faecalis]|uniref:hypothetical protein n=1 Tax=Peptostreptococcus faecalis TaxID=2045015 RepID=UPI000C7D7812|nr:hypothetical protein [Peptostreptococcus faecalis]